MLIQQVFGVLLLSLCCLSQEAQPQQNEIFRSKKECQVVNNYYTASDGIPHVNTQGPPGDKGAKGDMGLKGLKGDQGHSGVDGLLGPKGIKGQKGLTGQPADMNQVNEMDNLLHAKIKALQWMINNKDCDSYMTQSGTAVCISKVGMNYEQALKFCEKKEARLATKSVRNQIESREILDNLIKPLSSVQFVWIGLNDLQNEGTWMYLDGVSSTKYNTDWKKDEPNNSGNEDCAHYWRDFAFKINDVECDREYYAMCEKI